MRLDGGAHEDDRQPDGAKHQAKGPQGLEGGKISILNGKELAEAEGGRLDVGGVFAELGVPGPANRILIDGGAIDEGDIEPILGRKELAKVRFPHQQFTLEDAVAERRNEAELSLRAG